jgi:protein-tyrosine phosphatase
MSNDRGPIPNSYRLLEGRLIAGEYPGDRSDEAARAKLGALLDAGVTCFVDLTEPHELDPYHPILAEEAAVRGVAARHVRLSIIDVSVPDEPELMEAILDTIDAELVSGGKVYVHCWGGIGRTGTAVGCHLVRSGMSGDDALARVAELFRSMEKYTGRRRSPETAEQEDYVRSWRRRAPNVDPDDDGAR